MGLSNTRNTVHNGEKKLVGTQGYQCGDCYEIPETRITLPGGAGEHYKRGDI